MSIWIKTSLMFSYFNKMITMYTTIQCTKLSITLIWWGLQGPIREPQLPVKLYLILHAMPPLFPETLHAQQTKKYRYLSHSLRFHYSIQYFEEISTFIKPVDCCQGQVQFQSLFPISSPGLLLKTEKTETAYSNVTGYFDIHMM